jgi:hypothetical protein
MDEQKINIREAKCCQFYLSYVFFDSSKVKG